VGNGEKKRQKEKRGNFEGDRRNKAVKGKGQKEEKDMERLNRRWGEKESVGGED
jgi:hypothetical protein